MENDKETQEANDQSEKGEGEKVSEENTGDRVPSEQVGKVRQDLEDLRTANDEVEKELLRRQELKALMRRGGQTDAGQEAKKEDPSKKMADEIAGAFK